MEPTQRKKPNKILVAIFAIAFIFFGARFAINGIRYLDLTSQDDSSLTGRNASVQELKSNVGELKNRSLWVAPSEASNIAVPEDAGDQDEFDDGYTIKFPSELWNDWKPWSYWRDALAGDPLPPFTLVDLSDPALDIKEFRTLYSKSDDATRMLCLQDIMCFDLTRNDLMGDRRQEILALFKELALHDAERIDVISSNFIVTIRIPGVMLDRYFEYADIISTIINTTPTSPIKPSDFSRNLRRYERTMNEQLSLVDDPVLREKMASEAKKWFG